MRSAAFWPRELSLKSLRGRVALLLALVFLPAGAFAMQAGFSSMASRDATVQGAEGVRVLSDLNAVRDEVTRLRESVRLLAANPDLLADSGRRCGTTLREFAERFPYPSTLSVLNARGSVVCSNTPDAGVQNAAAQPLVLSAARRGDAVVGFVPAPSGQSPSYIAAVAPATSVDAASYLFVNVMREAIPPLRSVGSQRPGGFVALFNRNGDLLASIGIDPESAESERLKTWVREAPESALSVAVRVEDRWAVAAPLEEHELYLAQGWTPAPTGWGGLMRASWALLAPVLLWLAAVGATWFLVEVYVARPLLVVEDLARAYARGEDSGSEEQLLIGAPSEISSLRRTLAAMAKTLRGREARLVTALQEERALLLEVHHRVKNNLQMVASILSIQARGTADPSEARGLARAQDRVQLLALAQAQIYASGELREIALDQLAGDTARALVGTRGHLADNVRLDFDLEPVRVSADLAVPLAFLIGEHIASVFDSAEQVESLRIALAPTEGGGFRLELDAEGRPAGAGGASGANRRLTSAFARQLGAVVTEDPDHAWRLRVEVVAPLAPEHGDAAKS
jgi:two-component sensor histidine kinase